MGTGPGCGPADRIFGPSPIPRAVCTSSPMTRRRFPPNPVPPSRRSVGGIGWCIGPSHCAKQAVSCNPDLINVPRGYQFPRPVKVATRTRRSSCDLDSLSVNSFRKFDILNFSGAPPATVNTQHTQHVLASGRINGLHSAFQTSSFHSQNNRRLQSATFPMARTIYPVASPARRHRRNAASSPLLIIPVLADISLGPSGSSHHRSYSPPRHPPDHPRLRKSLRSSLLTAKRV